MNGIIPAVGLILVFCGLVAVAIYEIVTATQLSLPTAPLTIPTLILPFLAVANAVYTQRVSDARRRRGRLTNKPGTGTGTVGPDRPRITCDIHLVVTSFQLVSALMLIRSSYPPRPRPPGSIAC
ncbi:hypothetical protein MAPG_06300 [Magnaporthiopsis poae ATCC 64411]|uniref:Transmembrane protein n=1 Tax=Magnaporthiopsis poae (strain ATCC 64411 / 73-15) TaxID=644358 RepID=A0A0C4E1N5_MAGP6|nr:hypothetical protein MAPG_06300 [Magnaporthiopsis poae ATCC 64411]